LFGNFTQFEDYYPQITRLSMSNEIKFDEQDLKMVTQKVKNERSFVKK
jgi:hypothetical protein